MPSGGLKVPENSSGQKRGQISDLFKDSETKRTTIYLWLIWFQCAFAYYGLVLLSTALFQEQDALDSGANTCPAMKENCELSCKTLNKSDYHDLLWVTLSEFPGLLITMLILEVVGRKMTMAITFFGFAGFSTLVLFASSRATLTFFLFSARALISGGFQASFVYTPEAYPTNVRALGLGTCSGMARIGALLTPFVAQVMMETNKTLGILIYAVLACMAGVCALLLPIETKGRILSDDVKSNQNQTSL